MKYLSWILMWFEAISGLRTNLDKSELIPVGCVENVKALAVELVVRSGGFPPLIWDCLWELLLSSWLHGMEWKRGFERDW